MNELTRRRCKPCEGGLPALTASEARDLINYVPGWDLAEDAKSISKTYRFKDYHETMAFANAVAAIAHEEDHHPQMEIGYRTCVVRYTTHAIDGLSENDFICAAKADALLTPTDTA